MLFTVLDFRRKKAYSIISASSVFEQRLLQDRWREPAATTQQLFLHSQGFLSPKWQYEMFPYWLSDTWLYKVDISFCMNGITLGHSLFQTPGLHIKFSIHLTYVTEIRTRKSHSFSFWSFPSPFFKSLGTTSSPTATFLFVRGVFAVSHNFY